MKTRFGRLSRTSWRRPRRLHGAELAGDPALGDGKIGRPAGEYQSADASDVGKTRQMLPIGAGNVRRGNRRAKLVSLRVRACSAMKKRKSFSRRQMAFWRGAPAAHLTEVWRRHGGYLRSRFCERAIDGKAPRAPDHDGR